MPLLADLKPVTQRTYLAVLNEFQLFASTLGLPLSTRTDVDKAAFRFVAEHTRSRSENLLAALHRCYPLLRGHMRWMQARLKVIAVASPPNHHIPMDWLIAVAVAYRCVLDNRPRHGAQLLLQWKYGLRPTECLNLHGADLHSHWIEYQDDSLSFMRVGALRGTKAGRPQIVRARPHDRAAIYLLWLFARSTPPDSRLTDLKSTAQLQSLLDKRLKEAHISQRFTPHSPRAGWATARHAQGQSFPDLREDGRWRSDASLRIYLDVVSNFNTLAADDIRLQLDFLRHLSETLESWLVF